MSKASEYAELVMAANVKRPPDAVYGFGKNVSGGLATLRVRCGSEGRCDLSIGSQESYLSPEDAIRLAKYLLEYWGEE